MFWVLKSRVFLGYFVPLLVDGAEEEDDGDGACMPGPSHSRKKF